MTVKQQPSWVITCKIEHNVAASHTNEHQALHGMPDTQLLTGSSLLELNQISHTGQDGTVLLIKGLLLPIKDLLLPINCLLLPYELIHLAVNISFAQDLRDLFRVVPSELEGSETQYTLHQLHSHQRKATPYVQDHLRFLETLPRYAGTHTLSRLLRLNKFCQL